MLCCTRFAPSPTGYLHLGHALAARYAFDFARQRGGHCLLRMEDIDHTRCKREYSDAILEDLTWLGLLECGTPPATTAARPASAVRVQSEHKMDYDNVIENLRTRGLVYRCFKSRSELPRGKMYRGPPSPLSQAQEIEMLAQGLPYAWRLSMLRAKDELSSSNSNFHVQYHNNGTTVISDPSRHGDVVLARKDIGTSYHVAAAHDDHIQGITHVVRGRDLQDQTDIHVLLQRLMDWSSPQYHHHALLMVRNGDVDDEDSARQKMSKRNRDTTIRSLRGRGYSPDDVFAMVSAGVIR